MLKALVFLIALVFGTSKVMLQGKLTRTILNNSTDFALYNTLVFFGIGLVFFVRNGFYGLSGGIALYVIGYAVFNALFQFSYTTAMKNGPVAISALMINLSAGITVVFGIFRYGDIPSRSNLFGFVFLVISLVLSADLRRSLKEKMSTKWLAFSLLAALFSAAGSIVSTEFARTHGTELNGVLLAAGNLGAGIIMLLLLALLGRREKRTVELNVKNILFMLSVAAALSVYQPMMLRGLKLISSAIYYPLMYTSTITVISLLSFTVFHDRLNKRQIYALVSGLIAIVLLAI